MECFLYRIIFHTVNILQQFRVRLGQKSLTHWVDERVTTECICHDIQPSRNVLDLKVVRGKF